MLVVCGRFTNVERSRARVRLGRNRVRMAHMSPRPTALSSFDFVLGVALFGSDKHLLPAFTRERAQIFLCVF